MERILALQECQKKVKEYVEESRISFIKEKYEKLLEVFPKLSQIEQDILIARYIDPQKWLGQLTRAQISPGVFTQLNTIPTEKITMPSYYTKLLEKEEDMRKTNINDKNKRIMINLEKSEFSTVLQIPVTSQNVHTYFQFKKNTLLALQVINRLAREYEIRFEDVETVLKECLV